MVERKGDLPFDGRVSFFCSWTKVRMGSFSRKKCFIGPASESIPRFNKELQKYGII